MRKIRLAVVGAGAFGRNHVRVASRAERVELVGVVDLDRARAEAAAAEFGCPVLQLADVPELAEAAIIAVPTTAHASTGCPLLEAGVDGLVLALDGTANTILYSITKEEIL